MGQDPASEPSREWLEHAHTPAARIAIQRWLAAHPSPADTQDPAVREAPDTTETPAAAPRPSVEAPTTRPSDASAARPATANAVVDQPGASARLAGCCTPVPPDEVTGFAVRGGVVTVHRVECAGVARMKSSGRAEVEVRWGDTAECRVTLVAESFGRPHLLADLTEAIALEGVAIVSATVEPPSQQRVRHTYTLQLPDAAHLPGLMRAMRNVPGVYDVSRAQHAAAAAQ
jgi:GTP pyrophosphokinase